MTSHSNSHHGEALKFLDDNMGGLFRARYIMECECKRGLITGVTFWADHSVSQGSILMLVDHYDAQYNDPSWMYICFMDTNNMHLGILRRRISTSHGFDLKTVYEWLMNPALVVKKS